MQAMHGRLSDPGSYGALQHFITDSPWEAAATVDAVRDARPGSRWHSGARRHEFSQTRPTLGRREAAILRRAGQDCQLPGRRVDRAARRSARVAASPSSCTSRRRGSRMRRGVGQARMPEQLRFREKWRIALSPHSPRGEGRLSAHRGRRRCRLRLDGGVSPRPRTAGAALWRSRSAGSSTMWTPGARRSQTAAAIAAQIPDAEWQRITWAAGTKGPLAARFAAVRVRPAKSRGERWLLCERSLAEDERKYYLLNLAATATLHELVTVVRSRWPIEQQYRELKDELGIDHFEGRSYRGLDASHRPHRDRFHVPPARTAASRGRASSNIAARPISGCARSSQCSMSSTTAS